MAHLLVVSNVGYLETSASSYKNRVILGLETMFLSDFLLNFDDIENRRRLNDAPWKAPTFTHQALYCLMNIADLNRAVHLKYRQLLMWYSCCHADLLNWPVPNMEPLLTVTESH
jgi:hypothetical protein